MDDIVGIITQFAKYLSDLIKYLKAFLDNFSKKEEATTEEGTTAAE